MGSIEKCRTCRTMPDTFSGALIPAVTGIFGSCRNAGHVSEKIAKRPACSACPADRLNGLKNPMESTILVPDILSGNCPAFLRAPP